MNKCLVTKLNGVVSNKDLTPLGCAALTVYHSDNTFKLECEGNNVEYFTANGETIFSTDKSNFVNRISANQPVFVKADKPTLVFISNKYELTKVDIFDSADNAQLDIDFSDFKYCKKVEKFNITNFKTLICDISALSSLASLHSIDFNGTNISGDISALSSLTSLQNLVLSNTSVSGDISALSSLTSLQNLNLQTSSVSGDISALSSLTSLQNLLLDGASVSGDISAFNNMVKLSVLKMGETCSGYFKTLCNSLKDNGKTSGTLTFWSYGGQIKIDEHTNCPNNDIIATFSKGEISYSGL